MSPMSETPDDAAPATDVEESDPNADSSEGVAGDMGVSSERKGPVRGLAEDVTYAAAPRPTTEDVEGEDVPPEQSAYDGQPEVNPDSPGRHESDPASHPGHGV
jgi:hypothetical protein